MILSLVLRLLRRQRWAKRRQSASRPSDPPIQTRSHPCTRGRRVPSAPLPPGRCSAAWPGSLTACTRPTPLPSFLRRARHRCQSTRGSKRTRERQWDITQHPLKARAHSRVRGWDFFRVMIDKAMRWRVGVEDASRRRHATYVRLTVLVRDAERIDDALAALALNDYSGSTRLQSDPQLRTLGHTRDVGR